MASLAYDAVLVVSFGGPERSEDVLPFLEHVVRGRRVPRARLLEVAEHYYGLGGRSPINDHNRALIAALSGQLAGRGPALPVYWGNRNWHPFLEDTLGQMARDGVRRAIAFVTAAFSSYSSCRQYRENIADAIASVGEGAPEVDKIRAFFNHPGFVEAMVDRLRAALRALPSAPSGTPVVLFTAHSIPLSMAHHCSYAAQITEAARLVSEMAGVRHWEVTYQSRSGPPSQPWLGPDICDRIAQLHAEGATQLCVAPIGFLSDHMEVLYDLDVEAARRAAALGMDFARAGTVGTHPAFVAMVRGLIRERAEGWADRACAGTMPPAHDVCPSDCCPRPVWPAPPAR